MKNVSAILMSWKHPAQGTEGREGGSRPAIAATPRAPAAKGVPNVSKMWSPSRGQLGFLQQLQLRGIIEKIIALEIARRGGWLQIAWPRAFMSAPNNRSGLETQAGGRRSPHGLVRGIPAPIWHQEQRKGKG